MTSSSIRIPSAPGPAPMWGLGASGNILQYARDPIAYSGRLFWRYGNVVSIVRAPVRMVNPGPGRRKGALATAEGAGVVVATGADVNREILTQHDRYHMVALPGRLYPADKDVSSRKRPIQRTFTGLFNVNGDEHRRHRRLLMPAFHKTRIDAYRDDMVRITEDLVGRYRANETRDVHRDMTEVTLRIATKTLFGEEEGERGLRLARMMQEWLMAMVSPALLLSHADWPAFPYRRFLNLTHAIDRETVAILRDKRARGANDAADMLSTLLAARDEDGSTLDEDDLVGHVESIFAAGHETSTNALSWAMLLLSQHAEVARDVEDELDAVLRGAPPSVDDLARLPLLDAVVKETMRVLPPVPMHPRVVAIDSELAGYTLPAGSEVLLSIFHMHHDPAVFSDPERFLPRRWETIKPTVYEYNPFSAGPRMCIGASFASMEIKIVLATLLQRFRLEMMEGARIDPRVAITMAPKGGLHMVVRQRSERMRAPGGVTGKIRALVQLPN